MLNVLNPFSQYDVTEMFKGLSPHKNVVKTKKNSGTILITMKISPFSLPYNL